MACVICSLYRISFCSCLLETTSLTDSSVETADLQATPSRLPEEEEEEPTLPWQETKTTERTQEFSSPIQQDESTLLDVFGEQAKVYLTQHLIPPTDVQCKWNWRYARCEPFCQCSIQYLVGDYHVGRACRLRQKNSPSSLPSNGRNTMRQKLGLQYETETEHVADDFLQTCQQPPRNPYTRIFAILESSITQVHYQGTQLVMHWIRSMDLSNRIQAVRTGIHEGIQVILQTLNQR